jgi:ABC-type transporter Mla subunit MlaD
MERGSELLERTETALDRNAEAFQDLRPFLRELTLRHERASAGVQKSLDALVVQTSQLTDQMTKMVGQMTEMVGQMTELAGALDRARREIVGQLEDQRKALFRILDRLPDNGQGGAAGA